MQPGSQRDEDVSVSASSLNGWHELLRPCRVEGRHTGGGDAVAVESAWSAACRPPRRPAAEYTTAALAGLPSGSMVAAKIAMPWITPGEPGVKAKPSFARKSGVVTGFR